MKKKKTQEGRVRRSTKQREDPSDAWFWTPEWQKGEREADADIKAGRVYQAKNVEDLIASLKK